MIYRKATFADVEAIYELVADYAEQGVMLARSRNTLYETLREEILSGVRAYGTRLPSRRTLSRDRGVSPVTVDHCFELLGAQTKACHLKDIKLETPLTVRLIESACGDGDLDLLHYIELAHAVSPDMPMIIEHLPTVEDYLESLRYVQDLIARSGKDLGFRR